jgi:hypothetical protein
MFGRIWRSSWLTASLLVALVLLLALQLWGLRMFGTTIDYARAGTWGDMTGSLASSAAVIVAVAGLTSTRRRYEQDARASRVEQQTRVYSWLEPRLRQNNDKRVWILRFENQTQVPIYEWKILLSDNSDATLSSSDLGPIRPGSSDLEISSLRAVRPGKEPKLTLEFVDVEGTRWRRMPNGACSEVHL